MAAHSPGYVQLVADAKQRVRQYSIDEFLERLSAGDRYIVLDVREESEWSGGHLPGAHHLGRGILEREIERTVPDKDAPLLLYCGGDDRSTLCAESLAKMGYTKVHSLDGGWHSWTERGLPTVKPGQE